ncbi:RNA polymerase sigma factor [Desulfonema magnum]|uniref:RNA polymerase sigma factor sigma-70 domain-containing protein n=1 Tax=Desulfonema magnum TaxID=45655 RepID=A0A975GR41_9BACT|nr:RNA polymerase sigma factor [Desulfonema magnum]QTA90671.1 RNA polymerase sigma factor sigma-70 domain-containing protein [Desulfonema magnum]
MADSKYQQVSELVDKARHGNRNSTDQLVMLFHEDIFRMVYYRTRSRMDAEDLTQEIFMQMIKSLPGLKKTSRFKSWLFRIALNRIKDFYRKKSILNFFGTSTEVDESYQEISQNDDDPIDKLMRKEFWEQFRQFTEGLPRWEREVFILRFADHLGIREIAETLKKNESTVKTHLYRALKKFRQTPGLHDLLKGGVP